MPHLMAHPVTLSKTKLLAYLQCPRKLWLEQYSPELEDEDAIDAAAIETGRVVGALAREVYGENGGHHVSGERGLRAAINATAELLAAGGDEPIFEATFDYDGLTFQVDVLERAGTAPRLVEVKSATRVKDHYLPDVAIQAWALAELGIPVSQVLLAHVDGDFVYAGDGNYAGLFTSVDLTESAAALFAQMPALVEATRTTLQALDEPEVAIGEHCRTPYICPFFAHCAPEQGEYPVMALGGSTKTLYSLLQEGYTDLREVPRDRLGDERQRRIQTQTQLGQVFVGAELRERVRALPRPRYYLDFETIAFAIPIWKDTRPYEPLPFQWSVHVDDGGADESAAGLTHTAFLGLSGEPPMRECAETLIETLGRNGPIVVYSGYEQRVVDALRERYPDLASSLVAIRERLVDLLPLVKAHYYAPAMRGSWSLKAVVPTVAAELDYDSLTEVRDGGAAQAAYLEAIAPGTTPARREQLRGALLEYCRYDTLSLFKLVEFFSRP
jgi:Domain of unknown function(DUF2779)